MQNSLVQKLHGFIMEAWLYVFRTVLIIIRHLFLLVGCYVTQKNSESHFWYRGRSFREIH